MRARAALTALLVAPGCRPATPPEMEARGDAFHEAGQLAGLEFRHRNGMRGELAIAEVMGAGAALFDCDGDGDLDALLVEGGELLPGPPPAGAPPRHHRLFRNHLAAGGGEPRFQALPGALGDAPGYGMGVAAGDYDNDGHVDLYLTAWGPDQLLRGRGDCAFEDRTRAAGLGDARWNVAAVFFDYDRDGWLDLWVGGYVEVGSGPAPRCHDATRTPDYCGPGSFQPRSDRLYRNRGDGTFADVTAASGLAGHPSRPALGAVAADFDGDGWLDLYVANDGQPNDLWINRRDGTFLEEGLLRGAAVNRAGQAEAGMGVDAGDYDQDGDFDLFLTHLEAESNTLYRNDGAGNFEDVTLPSGLGPPSLPFTSFGTGWLDYDNDGWLDLLVVSGSVNRIPELVARGDPFPLHQTKQLFRNRGDGVFADTTAEGGAVFQLSEVSRGAAFGDVDNDGDTDVLVANNNGPARLLLSQIGHRRRWLGLRLVAGSPPRDQLGARAALRRAARPTLWRRVHTDGSYASANDPRLLFGLGDDPRFTALVVHWPDGAVEEWSAADLEAGLDAYSTLHQGDGQPPARGDR